MIRSVLVVLAAVAATTISAAPVAAQELQKPQVVSEATRLRIAAAMAEARTSKVYIVRMAARPAASYNGGLSGFARTAAASGARYNARSGEAEAYTRLLQSQ